MSGPIEVKNDVRNESLRSPTRETEVLFSHRLPYDDR